MADDQDISHLPSDDCLQGGPRKSKESASRQFLQIVRVPCILQQLTNRQQEWALCFDRMPRVNRIREVLSEGYNVGSLVNHAPLSSSPGSTKGIRLKMIK